MQTAIKRYYLEFGGSMAAYTVVLIAAIRGLDALGPGSGWRYPVALLPVLPAAGALVAFIRYLRTMDELQRRIQFEAFGAAFAATILITFTYGFLEIAGLPTISAIWIGPGMIAAWGVISAIVTRRYTAGPA
jgi:hypothetical protein